MQDGMSDDLIILNGVQFTRQTLAPGKPHISHIQNGVEFFMPEVFHLAPTLQSPVPLCIKDYLESKSPVDVYFSKGVKLAMDCVFMIKNYPIRFIRLTVRILYEDKKEFEDPEKEDFYLLYVDDGSCAYDASLSVKVFESEYCRAGLSFNSNGNKIVTIIGRSNHQSLSRSSKRCIIADSVEIYCQKGDLVKHIHRWSEILHYRTYLLSTPWVIEDSCFANMRHGSMRLLQEETEEPEKDDEIIIVDSVVLNKEKWKKGEKVQAFERSQEEELIDLTKEELSKVKSSPESIPQPVSFEHDNFVRITSRSKYTIELLKFLLLRDHSIVKCALFLQDSYLVRILRDIAVGEVFNRGLSSSYPLSKTFEEYIEESKETIIGDTKLKLAQQGLVTFFNESCNTKKLRHLVTSARKSLEAVKKASETTSNKPVESGPKQFNSAIFLKRYSSLHASSMPLSVLNELIAWVLENLENDNLEPDHCWQFYRERSEWVFARIS